MNSLLPLDTFRQILKYPPYQFWGLDNADVRLDSQCNGVVYEYTFQSAGVGGRDDIRQALIPAQEKLRSYLMYPIAPQYLSETVTYPSFYDERLMRYSPMGADGGWLSVTLPDNYVQAVGVESLTLVGTEDVTYTDQFNTGTYDTFTLTIATDETDPLKLAVYFSATDRFDDLEVGDQWKVEPVQISISGGIATITGRSWILIQPILYEAYNRQNPLDPDTLANYVETLDVYVRTTNPNGTTTDDSQGVFLWDTTPGWDWWGFCCQESSDPAAVARALARVGIKNSRLGIVIPGEAVYNESTEEWSATRPPWSGICRPPQDVTVRYLAGYPLSSNGAIDTRLAHAVAYLAMAELPERICACDNANRTLYRYQQEINKTGTDQDTFAVTRAMLNNPLGNKMGHWYAWNEIQDLASPRGVSQS